jgi:rhamnosyltransferase
MISIVIRSKNERQYLGEVLGAILAQDDNEEFEIIVIDSSSTDGTPELASKFPVILKRIPAEAFTFGYALNLALGISQGRIIVNLSAHCTPVTHEWLRRLVDPLRNRPSLVATYGRQEPRIGLNPLEEQELLSAFPDDYSRRPAAFFSNANCAIWRSVLEGRPFDETVTSSEDLIWSLGFPSDQILYVPDASVYHSHPLEFGYWSRRFERDGIATVQMRRNLQITNPYIKENLSLTSVVRAFLGGCYRRSRFLVSRAYFSYLPVVPLFELMRLHSFALGFRKGEAAFRVNETAVIRGHEAPRK